MLFFEEEHQGLQYLMVYDKLKLIYFVHPKKSSTVIDDELR